MCEFYFVQEPDDLLWSRREGVPPLWNPKQQRKHLYLPSCKCPIKMILSYTAVKSFLVGKIPKLVVGLELRRLVIPLRLNRATRELPVEVRNVDLGS